MTQDDLQKQKRPSTDVWQVPEEQPDAPLEQFGYSLEEFVPLLISLRTFRRHLTTAPTFVPRAFLDQIQLYDSGGVRRLYLYVNGTWRYCTLT